MTTPKPPPRDYYCDTETCNCGCDGTMLIVDDEPTFPDLPQMRVCAIPHGNLVVTAMKAVTDASAASDAGKPVSTDTVLLSVILDGYLTALELLTRISTYGVDGTGDPDEDDDGLDRMINVAHDFVRAANETVNPCVTHSIPRAVQIDLGNVAVNLGIEEEPADADAPTPTTFEA